ncbi:peptidase S8/S53 domain-containing protein [Nemania sp. FL0031]|nr:peptidase S8/S53 domain-containing protein [Nemania sp. FL0031]
MIMNYLQKALANIREDGIKLNVELWHKPEDKASHVLETDLYAYASTDVMAGIVSKTAIRESEIMPPYKTTSRYNKEFLADLASIDEVRVIEEVHERTLSGNSAREILRVAAVGNFNQQQSRFDGAGEIVAVADTGLDMGHIFDVHPAFFDTQGMTRVRDMRNFRATLTAHDADGHGTHVCGLVLGNGQYKGTAPAAKLLFQSLGVDLRGMPANLRCLFQHAYDGEARVHNSSWNKRWIGVNNRQCDGWAREIDDFVWEHDDMIICFSAGNHGDLPCFSQIQSEASAKNCITVGSTMNFMPRCTRVDLRSSRGPTVERRIKPDVVAPGVCVWSG